jgi:hypothetical protein
MMTLIVAMTSQYMLSKCNQYFPLFLKASEGKYGWIAIQGNPFYDTDYDFMVNEAKRFYSVIPYAVSNLRGNRRGCRCAGNNDRIR